MTPPFDKFRWPVAAALALVAACDGATGVCDTDDLLCVVGAVPSLVVADAVTAEGTGTGADMTFTVTLSRAVSSTVTVSFFTSDGTAVAASDYESTAGTVSFAPGETRREITVAVIPDVLAEDPDETFNVFLLTPSGATLEDAFAVGTIVDDDTCVPSGSIEVGQTLVSSLDAGDCVDDDGETLEMWILVLAAATDVVVDQVSDELDSHLAVWEPNGTVIEEDDDDHFGTNARVARLLPEGRYLVVATSGAAPEEGDYELSVNMEVYGATASRAATSDLYRLDTATGTATPIGSIGFDHVSAIDFHPSNGLLYGLGERSAIDTTKVLITIDPTTGVGTEVGPLNVTSRYKFAGMSFRDDGTLFAYHAEAVAQAIYTIDAATGSASLVGPTGLSFNGGNGLVFDADGTLYHSNQDQSSTIDQAAGTAVMASPWTPPGGCNFGRVGGADRPPGGTTIYGVVKCDFGGSSGELLVTVDYPNGTATEIGPTTADMDAIAIR